MPSTMLLACLWDAICMGVICRPPRHSLIGCTTSASRPTGQCDRTVPWCQLAAPTNRARSGWKNKMRICIFSDTHGNVVALEAVIADMRTRAPFDLTIMAGDLAQFGPRPVETVD